ncbi:hypothetical protein JQC70_39125 [Burkholderia contaminans]|uniref:hypothetical protein n=1 Tax=Burkholderia contaminans TaxID=488447 RepID=UPI0015E33995|nr:hypothetical protein [Burkholderia contaminans]MBM6431184.1 hypothetical protein [Burkholderia contaminans]MCA7880504.1 hypothetical protein [Burkholderia contaminans]
MSAEAEAIPTFKADFSTLMSYLHDVDANPVSISPRRNRCRRRRRGCVSDITLIERCAAI